MSYFGKFIAVIILAVSHQVASSATYSVKGTVRDSIGEPESFATVRVFLLPDTVKPSALGVADAEGVFNIPLKTVGNYRVNINSVGKSLVSRDIDVTASKPVANIGVVTMKTSSTVLGEVEVTAARPLVTKEIDRIGYDVQADADSKTVQLDEMLRRVPLVSVESDGTIKVKGSSDFKIYKNGRPNNSFTKNAKEIFKAIPASMIKKIEVITDPGAREDAEGVGAILNIVTVENTVMNGVTGTASVNYNTTADYPSPNLWLSGQVDKVTLSAYVGVNGISRKQNNGESKSLQKYTDSGNELTSEGESSGKGYITWFGVDGSYELDSLNLFTAEFGGYLYNIENNNRSFTRMSAADGSLLYSYRSTGYSNPNRYLDFNGNFNYQHSTRRKGETFILSYLVSTTDQKQHSRTDYEEQENMPVPYTGTENNFKLNFIEHTAQADWTRPWNSHHTTDVGVKYIYRNNHSINDQDYFDDRKVHNDFIHRTQVFAVYADYRVKYKKWGARAGLRYEYSHLSAKYKDGTNEPFGSDLSDWVPNAALSYDINDGNSLKIGYSTRINRPGISQLNPAVVQSPTSVSTGNPDLGSSRHQSINLNYNFISSKFNLDFNVSHGFTNNAVIGVRELLENDVLYSSYINGGHNKTFNMSLFWRLQAGKKTSVMMNAGANYADYRNPSYQISANGWGYWGFMRVSQKLPWELEVSAMGNIWRNSISLYSKTTFNFSDNVWYALALQRSFLKEKRLTARVSINNPFGKNRKCFRSEPINVGYTGYNESYYFNQANQFQCSLSYRFGSINAQVKKTAKSIKNDDLEGRKN